MFLCSFEPYTVHGERQFPLLFPPPPFSPLPSSSSSLFEHDFICESVSTDSNKVLLRVSNTRTKEAQSEEIERKSEVDNTAE